MTEYISVIPDDIQPGAEHRYFRLPHPRTGAPQLYLPYNTGGGGLCEAIKVGGAKGRTWFIGDDNISQGSLLVHNPIDPLFVAIPIALALLPSDDRTAPFQPLPDLLAAAAGSEAFALKPAFSPTANAELWNPDMSRLVEHKPFRRAFRACCDRKLIEAVVQEGETSKAKDRAYYRPSRDAILRLLKLKVDNLAHSKEFGKFDHLVRGLGRDGLLTAGSDEKLVTAARTKASIDQIANYLPPVLLPLLVKEYDFAALDEYLRDRAAAAVAAAAPVINGKGKDKGGAAAKRKAASQNSRGVEALKKVKTEGMSKMTSFFKPKEKK